MFCTSVTLRDPPQQIGLLELSAFQSIVVNRRVTLQQVGTERCRSTRLGLPRDVTTLVRH